MVKEKSVFERLKKQNGEAFAKAIRNFDASIFEIPNLPEILKYAGREAESLLFYLEALKKKAEEFQGPYQDPIKLLKKAGYDAFVADTEEKKNSIAHLYAPGEEICTLKDPERHQTYFIIHAIKKGADKLNRRDFTRPNRQDEYGTSVISIQILKTGGFISIKNRYNHTVPFCDNTFDSNPDNIIKGLSHALKQFFKVDFDARDDISLPNGYVYQNGIYKYHIEEDNIYFGDGFYLKDGHVVEIDRNSQLLADTLLINLKKKNLSSPLKSSRMNCLALKREIKDKILQVKNVKGIKILFADGKEVLRTREGKIISLTLHNLNCFENSFTRMPFLEEFNALNLKALSSGMLQYVPVLKKANIPSCIKVYPELFSTCPLDVKMNISALNKKGCYQLGRSIILTSSKGIKVLNLYSISEPFLDVLEENIEGKKTKIVENKEGTALFADETEIIKLKDGKMISLCLPDVRNVSIEFSRVIPKELQKLELPNCRFIENNALEQCQIDYFKAPLLERIGSHCLNEVKQIEASRLKLVGSYSLRRLQDETHYFPCLEEIGEASFMNAKMYVPKLTRIKNLYQGAIFSAQMQVEANTGIVKNILNQMFDRRLDMLWGHIMNEMKKAQKIEIVHQYKPSRTTTFLLDKKEVLHFEERKLQRLCLNEVRYLEPETIKGFEGLESLSLPNLIEMGAENVKECPCLKQVYMPHLEKTKDNCFNHLKTLQALILPHLEQVREHCFRNLDELKRLDLPKLKSAGERFLRHTDYLERLYAPRLKNRLFFLTKHPNYRMILRDMDEANTKRHKKPVSFFRAVLYKDGNQKK